MKIINLEQGSHEWKQWRRNGLGGSDIANLMGLSPFEDATPEFLFREKVEGLERDTNFSMRRGTSLEPVARRSLEKMLGASYTPICVEHDKQPWMKASLDGCNFDNFRSEIVEIKCPKYTVHDYVLSGLCPDYYAVQCQWQLLVTGAEVCIFASYNNGQKFAAKDHLAYLLLYPDAEKQAEILEKAEEFWGKVYEAKMGALAGV